MQINKCATQGRQDTSQWVKSYSLQYSEDGLWFIDYQQNGVNTVRNPLMIGQGSYVSYGTFSFIFAKYMIAFSPRTGFT